MTLSLSQDPGTANLFLVRQISKHGVYHVRDPVLTPGVWEIPTRLLVQEGISLRQPVAILCYCSYIVNTCRII